VNILVSVKELEEYGLKEEFLGNEDSVKTDTETSDTEDKKSGDDTVN